MFPNGSNNVDTVFVSLVAKTTSFHADTSQFHYQAVVGQIFQYDIKRRVINAMVHRLFTNILPDH